MDYVTKLQRLDEHLQRHPHDYQSVISRLKMRSAAIEHGRYLRKVERLKRLAEVRRQLKEIESGKE